MAIYLYLLLLSSICSVSTDVHAIYLSVVEIQKAEGISTSITIKVFRDDLIDALRFADRDSLESNMTVLNEEEVSSYFNDHVKFYPDPAKDIGLDSYSIEGDSYFLDFELLRPFESIEQCSFTYFFELFPNQKNILKIETEGPPIFKTFKRGDQIEDL